MLKEFELEDELRVVEAKVGSVNFQDRSATNVRSYDTLDRLNSFAREFGCCVHEFNWGNILSQTRRRCQSDLISLASQTL